MENLNGDRASNHGTFRVQRKMCDTCIYKPDSPLDIKRLEGEIADGYGGFNNHRTCHHSSNVCCAGFWARHKDKFPGGQMAQRLDAVEFVDVDDFAAAGIQYNHNDPIYIAGYDAGYADRPPEIDENWTAEEKEHYKVAYSDGGADYLSDEVF